MKNRIQGILAGFLAALLLIGTVFAATTHRETKTLNYTDLKVVVDGETIDLTDASGNVVQPFSVDGVTYLPLRVMANAIGKNFASWDQQANIAYFGKTPGIAQYLTDVCPAYQVAGSNYKEYSALKSGGVDSFSLGGAKYTNGITMSVYDSNWGVHNLDGLYTSLSGVICHLDGSSNIHEGGVVQFFCDGVLAKEIAVTTDMYPQSFSLNITNVNQLKIATYNRWSGGYVGIGNPIIE